MQSIELIVNDISLDLDGKTNIALVLQAQDLGDISEKVGSFSRSFTIPVTEKNRRALDNSYTFTATTNFPYRKHRAILKVNGLELPEGIVIVESDGLNREQIRLTFYTGNAPAFQILKNTKLRSLCFYDAYHHRFIYEIGKNKYLPLPPQTNVYKYPLVVYNDDTNDLTLTGANGVNLNLLLPALQLSYVMQEITRAIGYSFVGDIITDQLFTNIFFPYSNAKFERDEYKGNRNNYYTNYLTTQITAQSPSAGGFVYDEIRHAEFDSLNHRTAIGYSKAYGQTFQRPATISNFAFTADTNSVYFADSGWYRVKRIYRWTNTQNVPVYFSNFVGTSGGGYPLSTMITTEVNGLGNVFTGINTQNAGAGNGGVDGDNPIPLLPFASAYYETVIESYFKVTAHTPYFFGVYSNQTWEILSTYWEQEFITSAEIVTNETEVLLDTGTLNLRGTIDEPKCSQSLISPSMCLPNVTVGEFLKIIANMFGCIIFINDIDKTIEFSKFQNIYNNIPYAKDWSDKVVNLKEHNWNTRPSKYGITNNYYYESIESLGGKAFSNYQLTIDDETLPLETDVVKIPFSGSETVERLNGEEMAKILLLDADGLFNASETKQRILLIDIMRTNTAPVTFFRTLSNGTTQTVSTEAITNNGGLVVGYFNRAKNMPSGSPQLGWLEYLWENYWQSFEQITEGFKELNCVLRLTPVDVQTLDFKIPVYLQQYNAYFYIQKISDWTGEKPVKVDLLKLN